MEAGRFLRAVDDVAGAQLAAYNPMVSHYLCPRWLRALVSRSVLGLMRPGHPANHRSQAAQIGLSVTLMWRVMKYPTKYDLLPGQFLPTPGPPSALLSVRPEHAHLVAPRPQ